MSKKAAQTKQYVCLIYAREEPTKFEGGLLGSINLERISFLVDGQGFLPKEPTAKASQNMKKLCESLCLPIKSETLYKSLLVIEVDASDSPIHEQMSWREIDEKDSSALGWRTVLYPLSVETGEECLGFFAAAKNDSLGGLYTVASIIPFMLSAK